MKLLVKGGTIVNPSGMARADLLVDGGKIVRVADGLSAEAPGCDTVYDASGKYVCPGFIDLHVHLREPGREDKETVASGTRAAAMGGFTTICAMPNTKPVADNQTVIEFVKARAARDGVVRVLPIGSITKGSEGREMAEMGELVACGCVGVSDDGKPVANARVMRHALEYAKMFGIPVMAHEEEPSLAEGDMNEGRVSTLLGLRGISRLAEEIMVARDILLAEETGGRLHLCHISTARSVELVRQAKARGVRVTAEATPHHFSLTEEAVTTWDTSTKVNPPLRTEADRLAIIAGLMDGTIDAIATDHAPHNREEKEAEYPMAPNGLVGLETAVPLAMHRLVGEAGMDMVTLVRRMSAGPAAVLGRPAPELSEGAVADITVIDPDAVAVVDPARFKSKSRNTPFAGMELKGWPVLTVVDGRIVMADGGLWCGK